jgi:hypothetical protein
MERWLLLVVVLYVVWRVLHSQGRRLLRFSRGADDFSRFSRDPRRHSEDEALDGGRLVVCASCGVVVAESDAAVGADGERRCGSCTDRLTGGG